MTSAEPLREEAASSAMPANETADAPMQAPQQPAMETPADPASLLQAKLDACELEISKLKDQLLRTVADGENMRKRFQRDQEDTSKYAVTGFARDLVNVIENMYRASATIPEEMRAGNEMLKTIADGVDMTMRELLSVFERHGIKRIDPTGLKFDHNYHQAVAQVEDATVPAGTVLQMLQAGYVIHDRLLRPAMVTVAKAVTGGEPPQHVDTQA